MSKLAVTLRASGPTASGKVVAQLYEHAASGQTTARSVVLGLGETTTLDVEPGRVLVRVCLPSGDVLSGERTVAGDDQAMAFDLGGSRHEWLGWRQTLSEQPIGAMLVPRGDAADAGPWIVRLRLHAGGKALELPLQGGLSDAGAVYSIDRDERTLSLTVSGYTGARPLVEIAHADGTRDLVAAPLPWFDDGMPMPVQLVTELGADGTRADVIVQDPTFSPVLAYIASGNRSAARELLPDLVAKAQRAVMDKFQSPIAGAAGALVLRRLQPSKLPEAWLENLAGIGMLSDGAILYASILLESRRRGGERPRARDLLLAARKRGLPVFAECVRMMRDGLHRLSAARPDDAEVVEALAWARDLAYAARADTIVTWLSADDATLARLAPEIVP